ncbi:DUF4224 domain-containing protein [Lysobacter sp. MMG2]|nr:DUF4224 domain-containing protein [Lysobacter sp. MMG2]
MSETWLTPDEVGELTALKPNSWKAQCRRLASMGIPFLPNAVGRPLVERTAVLKGPRKVTKPRVEPNWPAINSVPRRPKGRRGH